MTSFLIILICILLLVTIFLLVKISKIKVSSNNTLLQLNLVTEQLTFFKDLNKEVKVENDVLLSERTSLLKEKLLFQKKEIEHLHRQTTLQFESIAQKLLEEKSERFTAANKQNIDAILQPLNENIERFKKQVEETYDKESKIRFSLDERIRELMLQTNKISTEANNLANALKTNHKKQGDWGELILENILQKSGLVKNR